MPLPWRRADRDYDAVTVVAGDRRAHQTIPDTVQLATRLVELVGGRYSTELDIDLDKGEDEIERWFLAATLFGARITAAVAERTFRVLHDAGIRRISEAGQVPTDDLVALLDRGGYARYDFRTAARLHALAVAVNDQYEGRVALIGQRVPSYATARAALDALPGWGPVTVRLFLRELRGVWLCAEPPLDERAVRAAHHLGFIKAVSNDPLGAVTWLAFVAHLDVRDLEASLVRVALAHGAAMNDCPGGISCTVINGPRNNKEERQWH